MLRRVAASLVVLACVGCRNQIVQVDNDSETPVRVSVARSWSGVIAVPPRSRGEAKARLRPGLVEVAIERSGWATALGCEHRAGEPRLVVRIPRSGRAECGNSPAKAPLP